MGLIKDREKWLQFLDDVEEPAVSPLATSPEFMDGGSLGLTDPTYPSGEQAAALILTFRIVRGASDDELAAKTSLLLRCLSQKEQALGGDGLDFDVAGSTFGPDRVVLRLFPSKREGAGQRVALLAAEMNSEGRRVSDRAGEENDDSIAARIQRDFKSPFPESAMRQLEMAVVA
jgi:hypothetical protein